MCGLVIRFNMMTDGNWDDQRNSEGMHVNMMTDGNWDDQRNSEGMHV
jgi:hypothetical protein